MDYVSQTIDLLEMLSVKTKGNTTEEIEKTIVQMVSELKLNYVDEKNKKVEDTKEVKKENGTDKK